MMKKALAIIICIVLTASLLTGCKKVVSSGTIEAKPTTAEQAAQTEPVQETISYEAKSTEAILSFADVPSQDLSNIDVDYQDAEPVEGEEVAVIHTNFGDISFRFFDEVAPMAVENFKALAKAGRYDNTIIHRIFRKNIHGIQGGDYTSFNGKGGVSAFGETFGYEISDYVHNSRGSVAMAHSSLPDSNGSQFYINQQDNFSLDGDYTVFGQIYDGMDVVDAIYGVDTYSNEMPLEDVIVTSVEITTY